MSRAFSIEQSRLKRDCVSNGLSLTELYDYLLTGIRPIRFKHSVYWELEVQKLAEFQANRLEGAVKSLVVSTSTLFRVLYSGSDALASQLLNRCQSDIKCMPGYLSVTKQLFNYKEKNSSNTQDRCTNRKRLNGQSDWVLELIQWIQSGAALQHEEGMYSGCLLSRLTEVNLDILRYWSFSRLLRFHDYPVSQYSNQDKCQDSPIFELFSQIFQIDIKDVAKYYESLKSMFTQASHAEQMSDLFSILSEVYRTNVEQNRSRKYQSHKRIHVNDRIQRVLMAIETSSTYSDVPSTWQVEELHADIAQLLTYDGAFVKAKLSNKLQESDAVITLVRLLPVELSLDLLALINGIQKSDLINIIQSYRHIIVSENKCKNPERSHAYEAANRTKVKIDSEKMTRDTLLLWIKQKDFQRVGFNKKYESNYDHEISSKNVSKLNHLWYLVANSLDLFLLNLKDIESNWATINRENRQQDDSLLVEWNRLQSAVRQASTPAILKNDTSILSWNQFNSKLTRLIKKILDFDLMDSVIAKCLSNQEKTKAATLDFNELKKAIKNIEISVLLVEYAVFLSCQRHGEESKLRLKKFHDRFIDLGMTKRDLQYISVILNYGELLFDQMKTAGENKCQEYAKIDQYDKNFENNCLDEIKTSGVGLTLIWPFLQELFRNLGWIKGDNFVDEHAAIRAATSLGRYFDKNGIRNSKFCIFSNILCGLPFNSTAIPLPEFSEQIQPCISQVFDECFQLISDDRNVIKLLKDLAKNRTGVMVDTHSGWCLLPDIKTGDIVIRSVPWDMEFINLPWLYNPIKVDWGI